MASKHIYERVHGLLAFIAVLIVSSALPAVISAEPIQTGAPVNKERLLKALSPNGTQPAPTTNSNAYIEVVLQDDGKFTIGTMEGDPSRTSDNNKDLIFGHPSPSTSDTIAKVDGVETSIHSWTSSGITSGDGYLSVTLSSGSIQILERLTIVKSKATRNKDTIEIFFRVTNTGTAAHTVSLRTQLDTLLGDNDGAPFRIPDIGEITQDREFDFNPNTTNIPDIPSISLVLDNLTSPNIIALFTFLDSNFRRPDRVVFGYWPAAVGNYDYTVVTNRSFLDNNGDGVISGSSPDSDSCVNVYWGYPDYNTISLSPGASADLGIFYGLGNCSFNSGDPFDVLICCPSELEGSVFGATYSYSPNPLTLVAFFSNKSGSAISGASARLNLLSDFKLVTGVPGAKTIETTTGGGMVAPGGTAQANWQIFTYGRMTGAREMTITVNTGAKEYTVRRKGIYVLAIPNVLYGQATDENGNPISGAVVSVLRGTTVLGMASTQADGTYVIQGLAPGEYTVRLSGTGYPASYFQAYVVDSKETGRTTNPGAFQAGSVLEGFVYPNPVREGSARITFFLESAQSVEVELFNAAGELIQTIKPNSTGPGWNEVEWRVDGVANGIYFYQITAGGKKTRGKIAVVKRNKRT